LDAAASNGMAAPQGCKAPKQESSKMQMQMKMRMK
jgi:hypothetical protein